MARDDLDEVIRAIVESATGQSVNTITPVDGEGEVNEVRFVSTKDAELVIRLGRGSIDVQSYHKEEWCMEATAELIPGARVVAIGERESRPFMIQTRIPGVIGTRSKMSRDAIWTQLGRYARRLDEVPVRGCGYHLTERGRGVFRDAWPNIVHWFCDYLFDDDLLVRLGAVASADVDALREQLAALSGWEFEPKLNHGNFAEKNTIVGNDGLVSVIDWGTAESSRGLYVDIAEVVTWGDGPTLGAFLRGCEVDASEWRRMRSEVDALVVRRCMTSVRWAHEIGHAKLDAFVSHARVHADRIRAGEPPFGIP